MLLLTALKVGRCRYCALRTHPRHYKAVGGRGRICPPCLWVTDAVPLVQGYWFGLGVRLDLSGKSRPPPGFDPRTFQPVASHYTGYPILAGLCHLLIFIIFVVTYFVFLEYGLLCSSCCDFIKISLPIFSTLHYFMLHSFALNVLCKI